MRIASFLSVLGLAVCGVACSSSGSGTPAGGGSLTTTAPATKTIDTLTDAEAQQFCKEVSTWASAQISAADSKKIGCSFAGGFSTIGAKTDAEAKTMCKAAYDKCLAEPDKPSTSTPTDCSKAGTDVQKCKGKGVTVGDFVACQEEQVATLKLLATTDTCASAKVPTDGPAPGGDGTGPKCMVIKTKCPELASSSTSGGSPTPG